MRKSVAIFLHMEGDQPGYIADYLEQNNIPFKLVRLFKGDIPPSLDDVIGLVFMGGTMSVNDNLAWLKEESVPRNCFRKNSACHVGWSHPMPRISANV